MKIHIKIASDDERLSRFVCVAILSLYLINLNAGLASWTGISASVVSNVFKVILGIIFVAIIPVIIRRLTLRTIVFVLVAVAVSVLNLLIFPATTTYFSDTMITFFTMCMTVCIVTGMIRDFSAFLNDLTITSYIIAVITAVLLVGVFTRIVPSFNDGNYSMGFGYACLVPVLILISIIFLRRSIWAAVMAGIMIVALIAFGSRGPFLGIILFALYFGARVLVRRKKYLWLLLAIIIVALILFFYQDILTVIANLLEMVGFQSRTIRLMASDMGSVYFSGRNVIYSTVWQAIKAHPFAIRGINADHILVGNYSHNMVLELLYEFGAFFGVVILLYLAWRIWKTLSCRELSEKNILCILFMFASIPQLMVSGSLWTNSMFWVWLAFSIYAGEYLEIKNEVNTE